MVRTFPIFVFDIQCNQLYNSSLKTLRIKVSEYEFGCLWEKGGAVKGEAIAKY